MRVGRCGVVGVVVLAAMGCGSDGGSETSSGDVGSPEGGALAEVVSIDAAVDVALGDAEFVGVGDPVPVAMGDVVRTDASGFAEVGYFDGSVTRLDVDSELVVVALSDEAGGSVVRTAMGVGRTWNRVEDLAGDDEFVVETSVATAAVRGTTFVIDCPDEVSCSFEVLDGVVEVTPVGGDPVEVAAPAVLEVRAEGAGDPAPLDVTALVEGDPWLTRNADLDAGGDAATDDGSRDEEVVDVNVDVCSLLDAGAVRELTGETTEFTAQPFSGSCMWTATDPAVPAFLELGLVSSSGLPGDTVARGCAVSPVGDLGEEAQGGSCPSDPDYFVFLDVVDRGAVVSLRVHEPSRELAPADLVPVLDAVLDQLG